MDANIIFALIIAAQLGIQLDCNRRVRELQRTNDLQLRYFDALTRGTLLQEFGRPPKAPLTGRPKDRP